jgi:hypothetical protein
MKRMPNAKSDTLPSKKAFDKGIAKAYAAYKLAALNYLTDKNCADQELLLNTVIQNFQ